MKNIKIKNLLLAGASCLLLATSCDVDPTFYSQVVPETYYTNSDAVWSRFNRPFTHWRWWEMQNDARVRCMELGTDAMCVPTRGNDWFDGAVYQNIHHHQFADDISTFKDGWDLTTMGVAQAWSAKEDIENVDFAAVGMTEEDRTSMVNQLNVLAACFYLDALDMFGGMPLYTSTQEDVKGRSTDLETFNFIDSLLDTSIPNLPVKTVLGEQETNIIHQAVAACLKMRLYFNAESYIGQPMYEEAAQICQDIIDGKCVRLSQGDYASKKVYNEDPLEVARAFEDSGLRRLHVVDLDGAKAHHIVNYKTLETLATRSSLTIDFGGGLKSDEDLKIAFDCGAQMVTGGSIAVKSPATFEAWITRYGPERIILGADVKEKKIAVGGWLEASECDLFAFVSAYQQKGITQVITTDIARDGMLQGPSVDLYAEMLQQLPGIYLIASGGVSSIDDIQSLDEAGVQGVIFGKAIYEGRISLRDLRPFL